MTKRILVVRRSSRDPENDEQFQSETSIIKELAKDFDLESALDLSYEHSRRVNSAFKEGKKFDGVITHVPPVINGAPRMIHETSEDYFRRCYDNSLSILRNMKLTNPHITIIGYTAARRDENFNKVFMAGRILTDIVLKSHPEEWIQDYQKIKNLLRIYLG